MDIRNPQTEAIHRICQMEQCFDALSAADPSQVKSDPLLRECLILLTDYYENGQWLHDYELDEQGLLPANLKRGVLSQDAVYNLLELLDITASKI